VYALYTSILIYVYSVVGGCVAVVGKQDRHGGRGSQGVGGRPAKQRRRRRHSGVNFAAVVFVASHSSS